MLTEKYISELAKRVRNLECEQPKIMDALEDVCMILTEHLQYSPGELTMDNARRKIRDLLKKRFYRY